MTPDPALWNWRSRGLESGGASKKRRKNGSSSSGLRWPGSSLMVPRVAILTTAGETRLTMGASDGIGAASATGAGKAAYTGAVLTIAVPAMTAAARVAAANSRRRFMRSPFRWICSRRAKRGRTSYRPALWPPRSSCDITRKIVLGGPSYAASTVIRCGCTCANFGIATSSTPLTNFALMFWVSAESGSVNRRWNSPVMRSTRR